MSNSGKEQGRRVGDLATATGLTIRTLHYYEEIGLLLPSERTGSGHRIYAPQDVARLYRICLLRRLGLPLTEITRVLDDPEWNLRQALKAHQTQLEQRLEAEGRLRERVARLLSSLADEAEGPITDELLTVMEDMTMLDASIQKRISILVYSDLQAAHDFLVRAFQLGPGQLMRDSDGNCVHGELQAGDGVVWLHPESTKFGLTSPRKLKATTGMVAVMVDDVDAHFRHAKQEGADIEYEPMDQPYGYREYSARDLEGSLWSFMKALD